MLLRFSSASDFRGEIDWFAVFVRNRNLTKVTCGARFALNATAPIRVVHVLSPDNADYHQSMLRSEHRALGATVNQAWHNLLRRPGRFVLVDSALFIDREITLSEYAHLYGAPLTPDLQELLDACRREDGDGLEYPFTIEVLNDLVAE